MAVTKGWPLVSGVNVLLRKPWNWRPAKSVYPRTASAPAGSTNRGSPVSECVSWPTSKRKSVSVLNGFCQKYGGRAGGVDQVVVGRETQLGGVRNGNGVMPGPGRPEDVVLQRDVPRCADTSTALAANS